MKRLFGLVFFFFFLMSFVSAVDTTDVTVGVQEVAKKTSYDYLSEQWQKFLLKQTFFIKLDAFLKYIDIVFVIFLGQHYTLSLDFFLVIIFWALIYSMAFDYLFFAEGSFGEHKTIFKMLGGVAISTLLAQVSLYHYVSRLILITIWEKPTFIGRLVAAVFTILLIAVLYTVHRIIKKDLKSRGEKALVQGGIKKLEARNKGIDEAISG